MDLKRIYVLLGIALIILVSFLGIKLYKSYAFSVELLNKINKLDSNITTLNYKNNILSTELKALRDDYNLLLHDNTSYRNDIAELMNQIIEADAVPSLEKLLYSLMKKDDKTETEIELIYLLMPEVNIREFNDLYDDESVLYFETAMQFAKDNLDTTHTKNMVNYIKLSNNLDGCYAEGYSYDISALYQKDHISLLNHLAEIPSYTDSIFSYMAFQFYYDGTLGDEIKELDKLYTDKKLDPIVKEVVVRAKDILEYYLKNKI